MKNNSILISIICFLVLAVLFIFPLKGKTDKPLMAPDGYYVEGRYIYNAQGEKMIFRGVHRPGYANKLNGDHRSHANEFPEMARWGANIVRTSINQHWWLADENGYRAKVKKQIQLTIDNGMVAIASLQRSIGAANSKKDKKKKKRQVVDLKLADEESLAFWKDFAAEYKDNGKVFFELFNEPKGKPKGESAKVWMHGGVLKVGKRGEKKFVGMQQLYDAIRELGAHNVLLVAGLNWGYDLRGLHEYPMDKDVYNVVYVTHLYSYRGKLEENWADCWAWIIPKHPVLITEFGYNKKHDTRPDGTISLDYTKAIYKFAEDNELGWTAHAWTSLFLKHSIFVRNKPHTYDPANGVFEPLTEHGQLVKDNLAKNKK